MILIVYIPLERFSSRKFPLLSAFIPIEVFFILIIAPDKGSLVSESLIVPEIEPAKDSVLSANSKAIIIINFIYSLKMVEEVMKQNQLLF